MTEHVFLSELMRCVQDMFPRSRVPASHGEETLTGPIHHDEQACCTRSSPAHIKVDPLLCTGSRDHIHSVFHPAERPLSSHECRKSVTLYRVLLKRMDIWETSSSYNYEKEC
jgi:hypothetical protein